jgi:penicillin-binding protein-related factor A (putative recombinase)
LLPNAHYYKIPDPQAVEVEIDDGSVGSVKEKKKSVFAIKRPYDNYCLYKGNFFAFELKVINGASIFPFSKLKKHQEDALKEVRNNGNFGFVVINYAFKPNRRFLKKYGGPNKDYYFAAIIEIINYNILRKELMSKGLKGIPFEYIMKEFKTPPEHRVAVGFVNYIGGLWRIDDFIKKIVE